MRMTAARIGQIGTYDTLPDWLLQRLEQPAADGILSRNEPAAIKDSTTTADTPLSESIRRHIEAYFKSHAGSLPPTGVYDRLLPLFEKPLIETALQATGGNQVRTAILLGINRNTLHKKIAELGIRVQAPKPVSTK
jgi:two-component system, NtrC family, nitrogen regulation response regulator GlnG